MSQTLTISLPDTIYERYASFAKAARQSVDQVAVQSLQYGPPPDLLRIPSKYRHAFAALADLSNVQLWELADEQLSAAQVELYDSLLWKNQNSEVSEDEQRTLTNLREQSNSYMVRRAYIFALLKWRGQRVPPLENTLAA